SNTATATTGWLTNGEASVAVSGSSRIVTLGVAGRAETASQGQGVHGASLLLAPAASYTISFTPDLQTWDSYTPESVAGTGYWDSFFVSVGALPYWQRTDLTQDPLNLPFIWGGANFDPNQAGTGKETYTTARTVTVTSPDAAQPQYLSVVLDTNTQNQADSAYPSWGTITISAPAPLPVLPTVSVRTTPDRSQS